MILDELAHSDESRRIDLVHIHTHTHARTHTYRDEEKELSKVAEDEL